MLGIRHGNVRNAELAGGCHELLGRREDRKRHDAHLIGMPASDIKGLRTHGTGTAQNGNAHRAGSLGARGGVFKNIDARSHRIPPKRSNI